MYLTILDLFLPPINRSNPRFRHKRRQIPVSEDVAREEDGWVSVDQQLGADDWLDADALGLEREADRAAQVSRVSECERGVAQLGGAAGQVFRRHGTGAEGESAMRVKLYELQWDMRFRMWDLGAPWARELRFFGW